MTYFSGRKVGKRLSLCTINSGRSLEGPAGGTLRRAHVTSGLCPGTMQSYRWPIFYPILPSVKSRIKNKPSLHGFGAGVLCWLPQSLTRQPPQGGGLGVSDISQGIQQTRGAREQRAHIESERRAKAVKKNTRAAIWRTLQFPRAGMTVFFRLLNAATSLSGSRVPSSCA